MTRIFLHIGYPKTGTTSLQAFFAGNRDALKERGWLFPLTGMRGHAHYDLNYCLNIANFGEEPTQDAQFLKASLNEEIASSGCENVIISSEAFVAAKSVEPVKEFFSSHDLYAVVYLRRHDNAVESAYSQSVRLTVMPPWGPTIDSFALYQMGGLNTVPQDYLATLEKWAAVLGRDHIIVRPFEAEQNKPDLFADFLRTLRIEDGSHFLRPEHGKNASLSYETIMVIDCVMRASIDPDKKRELVDLLAAADTCEQRTRLLSPALRNSITTKYKASYAAIAREFMARKNGVLFFERESRPKEPWSPPSPVSMQRAIDILTQAITKT